MLLSSQKRCFRINTVRLHIHRIQVSVFLGHFEWEREEKQTVFVDIDMSIGVFDKLSSDQLKDTVDYGSIVQTILQKFENKTFFLIEKMAHDIIQYLFEHSLTISANVSVKKNKPLSTCQSASVTLSAENDAYFSKSKEK